MSVEFSVSTAFSVRQPAGAHGSGAQHGLPLHCHAFDQESGLYEQDRPHWRGHADPAFRFGAEPQHPFSDVVPRWRICRSPNEAVWFRWVKAPTSQELTTLTHPIAHRVGRFLERQGLLERDAENSYLAGDTLDEGPLAQLLGCSITYRIAVGPQQGRKVFTLQTLPARDEPFDDAVGKVSGFRLHAGVAALADERAKLERMCRYISRPAVSEKRLSLTQNGSVR